MTLPGQESYYQGPYPGPQTLLTRAEADAIYGGAADVAAEAAARIAADAAEAATRASADSTEVTNRTNADNSIITSLNGEIANRISGDTGLQTNINGKVSKTGDTISGPINTTGLGDYTFAGKSLARPGASKGFVTSNQTGITAGVDLSGASVTLNLVAGRSYEINASGLGCFSTVSGDVFQISLLVAGTQYSQARGTCNAGSPQDSWALFLPLDCVASGATAPNQVNAGSVTIKLQVSRNSGTGSLTNVASTSSATVISVSDVGAT
jgi:hypothetical protein